MTRRINFSPSSPLNRLNQADFPNLDRVWASHIRTHAKMRSKSGAGLESGLIKPVARTAEQVVGDSDAD